MNAWNQPPDSPDRESMETWERVGETDVAVAEADGARGGAVTEWETASGLADPYFTMRSVPLNMEVDDSTRVAASLTAGNARRVLDTAQRVRDWRERERASLRSIYNFGGESPASGWSDW